MASRSLNNVGGTAAILCLGGFLLASVAAAQLSISPATDTAILQGSPVTIRCRYVQAGGIVITLQLNGAIVSSLNLPDGSVLNRTSGNTELIIPSFSSNFSGQYQCHYGTFTGDLFSDTVTVEVAAAPQITRSLARLVVVNVTQPWSAPCTSNGVPAPDWELVRGDVVIARESRRGSVAFTKMAEPSDSDNYTCRARNLAGSDSVLFSVVVQTPATVTAFPAEAIIPIPLNTQLNLQCQASGTPLPSLEWQRNNSTVVIAFPGTIIAFPGTAGSVVITDTQYSNSTVSTLTVNRVAKRDAGVYVCRASNLLGQESNERTVVVQVPPGQPSSVNVVALQQTSAIIQWNPPLEDGFSAITAYFVALKKVTSAMAAQIHRVNASDLQLLLSGLDANTEYNTTVVAQNHVGTGAETPGFSFTTLPAAPPAPSNVRASLVGPSAITTTWAISPSWLPSQASLQYYSLTLQGQAAAANISASASSYDIVGLKKATQYTISVRSHNWALASSAAVIQVMTLGTKPSSPVLEDAVGVSSSAVRIIWREPIDSGGLPRLAYMLTWMSNVKALEASAVSHTVDALLANRNYTFTLAAVNRLGSSERVQVTVQTPASTRELLPVPNLPRVSRSNGSLLVRFPLEALSARASHWLLQYRVSGGQAWEMIRIERSRDSQCVDQLASDTQYEIRLAQAAQSERSFYSLSVVTRTLSPDLLPDVLILDVFSETVSLGMALCGAANLRPLVIEYRPAAAAAAAASSSSASWKRVAARANREGAVRIGGLRNNVTYSFRHVLLDESGTVIGTSVISTVTTLSRPPAGKGTPLSKATIIGVIVACVVVVLFVAVLVFIQVAPARWRSAKDKVFSPARSVLNNRVGDFPPFSADLPRPSNGYERNIHRPFHEEMSSHSIAASPLTPDFSHQQPVEHEVTAPETTEESVHSEMLVEATLPKLQVVPSSEVSEYAELQLRTPTEGIVVHSAGQPNEYSHIDSEATKRAREMRAEFRRSNKASFPDSEAEQLEHSTV